MSFRIVPLFCVLSLGAFFALTPFLQGGDESSPSRFQMLEPAKPPAADATKLGLTHSVSRADESGYYANLDIVDCFAVMSYRYTGGRYKDEPILFRLRIPETIQAGQKYPLIIIFHGAGESGSENRNQLAHFQHSAEFFFGPNRRDFFVLATQRPKDSISWETSLSQEGQGDAPLTIAKEILDGLLKDYPIDRDRISAIGICAGGSGAWKMASLYPDLLAAIATCSSTPTLQGIGEVQIQNMNFWMFNSTRDNFAPIEKVRQNVRALQERGAQIHLTEYDTSLHNSWTGALYREKLFGWLLLQHRGWLYPPPGEVYPQRSALTVFLRFGLPVLVIVTLLLIRALVMKKRTIRK